MDIEVLWVYDTFLQLDACNTDITRPKTEQMHVKLYSNLGVGGACNITLVVDGTNVWTNLL